MIDEKAPRIQPFQGGFDPNVSPSYAYTQGRANSGRGQEMLSRVAPPIVAPTAPVPFTGAGNIPNATEPAQRSADGYTPPPSGSGGAAAGASALADMAGSAIIKGVDAVARAPGADLAAQARSNAASQNMDLAGTVVPTNLLGAAGNKVAQYANMAGATVGAGLDAVQNAGASLVGGVRENPNLASETFLQRAGAANDAAGASMAAAGANREKFNEAARGVFGLTKAPSTTAAQPVTTAQPTPVVAPVVNGVSTPIVSPTANLAAAPAPGPANTSSGPDYSWMARNAEAQKKSDAEKKAYDATPQGMIEANQARIAAQMQAAGDAVPQSKAANTGVGWIDALVNNRNMNRDREAKLKAQSPFLQAQVQGSGDTIRSLLTQADPLHQAQTKTAQQAGATGDLVAKTQAIFADPNATEDQKKEAAITLRDLAGKGEGSKIASYDTLAPDGMTVLKKASIVGDRGTVDAEAATNATAAAATAKRYAQAAKTPAGLASLNKEHLAAVNKRAAGDPAKRASLLVEMNKHRAEHNLPPLQ